MSLSLEQRGAIALVAIAALAIPFAERLLGPRRPRFVYATSTLPVDQHARLAERPQWETFSTEVSPGVSLNGILRRPRAPDAPFIVFCSGNDPTPLATAQSFLERVREDRDWGIATWAYRGTDSSGGSPSRDALVEDASTLLNDLLSREQLTPDRVHVVAFSLGGFLAAHLAGQAASAKRRLASLSLLASVENIEMVTAGWKQRFFVGDVYEIQPLLDAVPAPVLVVHGSGDEALGVEQGRAIAKRLGARGRYVELPGAGHNALLETDAAISTVREFIESHSQR